MIRSTYKVIDEVGILVVPTPKNSAYYKYEIRGYTPTYPLEEAPCTIVYEKVICIDGMFNLYYGSGVLVDKSGLVTADGLWATNTHLTFVTLPENQTRHMRDNFNAHLKEFEHLLDEWDKPFAELQILNQKRLIDTWKIATLNLR